VAVITAATNARSRVVPLAALALVTAGCPTPPHDLGACPTCPAAPPVDAACADALALPAERLWPAPGELFYMQLGLPGLSLGEAALVVGPDGTTALVDVGNDSHDDNVAAWLADVVRRMNASGFPQRDPASVDHVVLTHFHADHADGLRQLLARVRLRGRVIHRGFVDLGAANAGTVRAVCESVPAGASVPLCAAAAPAPCDPAGWRGAHPATGCPGLRGGDLLAGDATGTGYLRLGEARMEFLAADGRIGGDSYESAVGPMRADDNGENARSLVGLLRHGPFRMLFAGDLTGGGSDTDPVEGFYASRLGAVSDLDARGVDVLHVGHHGRNTSSSPAWLDRLLPIDGRDRTAVFGISRAHAGSPHASVLDALFARGRLGGGAGWTTRVASFGETDARLHDADDGAVIVRTLDGGRAYAVQVVDADGRPRVTRRYHAVRACP